jgi:hypothetical protein
MKKSLLLIAGILLLIALEILRVYFIMPFPGSQRANTIALAYFLDRNSIWLRILLLLFTLPAAFYFLIKGKGWQKFLTILALLVYGLIFYAFNFRFLADKMFLQPRQKLLALAASDTTSRNRLVLGVSIGGQAKAYPIEIIGYHHLVPDTIEGQPILVTYCTVCRTGRIYSPMINGKAEQFRLVGMDHFNAMFEDGTTKSWWQQATGKAIAGPLKGQQLIEIPAHQLTLNAWLELHPDSRILQPDPAFHAKYDSLNGYDEGTIEGSLERRDSSSWKFKSWVIGLCIDNLSRAYDWNQLVRNRVIHDRVGEKNLLLTVEPDNRSFYAFFHSDSLKFSYDSLTHHLHEARTNTDYLLNGKCLGSCPEPSLLQPVQAYQEFWHSWKQFHPNTTRYGE